MIIKLEVYLPVIKAADACNNLPIINRISLNPMKEMGLKFSDRVCRQ